MVELDFEIEQVEVEKHSTCPMLRFVLRVTSDSASICVKNILLSCQIRIDPGRRSYNASERERLVELFGSPQQWGETVRSLLWTHANVAIPEFDHDTQVYLPAPCTRDFNLAITKYFSGVREGVIPLVFLFSGSVFYCADDGPLQVTQISWTKETTFQLLASVWQSLMDLYYPHSDWLQVDRYTFDRLHQFKRRGGYLTFDAALNQLLDMTAKEHTL